MVEIADAKKCCLCLPLRRGLLGISYFKLASSTGVLLFMVFFTMVLVYYEVLNKLLLAFVIVVFTMLSLDIIFDIIFIVSAHKKNYKYVRVYYHFLVIELISYVILLLLSIPWLTDTTEDAQEYVLGGIGIMLVIMPLHIYFIYLVRSEMRKLQLCTLFSFKNHVNEPECSVQIIN